MSTGDDYHSPLVLTGVFKAVVDSNAITFHFRTTNSEHHCTTSNRSPHMSSSALVRATIWLVTGKDDNIYFDYDPTSLDVLCPLAEAKVGQSQPLRHIQCVIRGRIYCLQSNKENRGVIGVDLGLPLLGRYANFWDRLV